MLVGFVLRVGSMLAFSSTQLSTRPDSQASPPRSVVMQASMSYLGLRTWDHVCSDKSQLPCSRHLKLHGWPQVTWDPAWTSFNMQVNMQQVVNRKESKQCYFMGQIVDIVFWLSQGGVPWGKRPRGGLWNESKIWQPIGTNHICVVIPWCQ